MNKTETHDAHMRKRMQDLMEAQEHKIAHMHAAIKKHDSHLKHAYTDKSKWTVHSLKQLQHELKE